MLSFMKFLGIYALLIMLSGCGYVYGTHGVLKDRDTDYLKAQSIPPLKIPAGYNSNGFRSEYPIPTRTYAPNLEKVDLTPPELYAK